MRNGSSTSLTAKFALDLPDFLAGPAIYNVRAPESLFISLNDHLAILQGGSRGTLIDPAPVKPLLTLLHYARFMLGAIHKLVQFILEMTLIVAHAFASARDLSLRVIQRGGQFNLDILLAHLLPVKHQMLCECHDGALNALR
jgi:hypothetical protein